MGLDWISVCVVVKWVYWWGGVLAMDGWMNGWIGVHTPICPQNPSYLRVQQLEEGAVALAVLRGRGDAAQVAADADDGLLFVGWGYGGDVCRSV